MKIALLILTLFPLALAANVLEQPHLVVTGTAEREVEPDLLRWNLRVETRGVDLASVARKHNATVSEVIGFLTKQGIDEADLQTSHMRFTENVEYRNGNRVRNGFVATTQLSAESDDFDAYTTLWVGLAAIDGLRLDSVSFDLDDPVSLQDEIRREALRNARDKAGELARVLGARVGAPLVIRESDQPDFPQPEMMRSMAQAAGDSAPSIAPGRITVRAHINVVFALITGN